MRDPILLASGCWEFSELFKPGRPDPRSFGGVITKAVTPEERQGNPQPRILPIGSGWMNSVGLRNPGIDRFCAEQLPVLLESGVGFFVNIAGHTVADFAMLVSRVEECVAQLGGSDAAGEGRGLLGFELNLSCPNVEGGYLFATDVTLLQQVIQQTRPKTDRLLAAKLSPNVTDIVEFADAGMNSGADAVTVANTWNGVTIEVATRKSRFARPSAGYSGSAVLPLAVHQVWKVRSALPKLPIFGSGGIANADSAIQHLLAGATVLEVGSALFKNPNTPLEIQAGLSSYLDEQGAASLAEIVGTFGGLTISH